MDFMLGLDVDPIFSALQHVMDVAEETERPSPTRAYMRDRKAMARTPADVKELPEAYVFEVDMPGLPGSDIKVQVEEGNLLRVSGQRKREDQETKEEKGDGVRYLKMERRMGKFMRQFPLPENANTDSVKASCKDGVVTVTVEKVPPPEPKKPKVVEVHVA